MGSAITPYKTQTILNVEVYEHGISDRTVQNKAQCDTICIKRLCIVGLQFSLLWNRSAAVVQRFFLCTLW